MTDDHDTGYLAVITVEIPNAPVPFEVSVTLFPADEIETGGESNGTLTRKPLRECTLADLMDFAEHLEQDLWANFATTPLSEFARLEEGSVKVRLPKAIGEEISDRDHWWHTTRVELGSSRVTADESGLGLEDRSDAAEIAADHDQGEDIEAQPEPGIEPAVEPPADDNIYEEPGESPAQAEEPAAEPAIEDFEEIDRSAIDLANLIVVSEPEPVFAERESDGPLEAVDEDATPPVHVIRRQDTENRLAGYRLPLDDPTPYAVDILFDEQPFRRAQTHALSSLTREVAGMLVGPPPEKQPNGRYVVHVSDVIPAKHTRMQGASVTYTPESWRYVNDVLLERYPDEECVIVGWYHTHPGFGIFLSNMDLFIHHNFFTQKWHIALVLDPVGQRSGFFTWNREQNEVMGYHFPWPYWAHSSW